MQFSKYPGGRVQRVDCVDRRGAKLENCTAASGSRSDRIQRDTGTKPSLQRIDKNKDRELWLEWRVREVRGVCSRNLILGKKGRSALQLRHREETIEQPRGCDITGDCVYR